MKFNTKNYENNQKLICMKDLRMNNDDLIAFYKGKTYKIIDIDYGDVHLTSELFQYHGIKENNWYIYFITEREAKLKRILK